MLDYPRSIVARNGIWALRGQTPLYRICDPRVLEALNVPFVVQHLPERAAGVLGFNPQHPAAVQLAMDWKRHALVREHIVPDNAVSYHKQDQAIFNCLLLKAAAEGALTLTDDDVDISSATPAKDITTRNIVNPGIPIWADPLVRLYFWPEKPIDQLGHRWKQFLGQQAGRRTAMVERALHRLCLRRQPRNYAPHSFARLWLLR